MKYVIGAAMGVYAYAVGVGHIDAMAHFDVATAWTASAIAVVVDGYEAVQSWR